MTTTEVAALEQPIRGIPTPLDGLIFALSKRIGGRKARSMEHFLRFAVVGASGAVIDLGLVFILQQTILPPENELWAGVAATIAATCAVLSNFFWTRYWVYPNSRGRSMRRQLAMFAVVSVAGLIFRFIWVAATAFPVGHAVTPLLEPFIHSVSGSFVINEHTEARIGTIVTQMFAMVVVMLWNFYANRRWTFNR